jgi:hypothetical protein
MIIAQTFSSEFIPDGVHGQYCVSAVTDTQTISCAKEQTEKTVYKSLGANLKSVGFSLRTLYIRCSIVSTSSRPEALGRVTEARFETFVIGPYCPVEDLKCNFFGF